VFFIQPSLRYNSMMLFYIGNANAMPSKPR
jgi:hypothetical protein